LESSGQRGRGAKVDVVDDAERQTLQPAQAIIAPLSVQSFAPAASHQPQAGFAADFGCSARRIAPLAATPPAATSALGCAVLSCETIAGRRGIRSM
jgi:hypothetical protein